jgi:hypothetical protein
LSSAAAPIWAVLTDDLNAVGVFRPADSILLSELCELLAECRRLRKTMDSPNRNWPKYEPRMTAEDKDELLSLPEAELLEQWPMSTAYRRIRTSYMQSLQAVKSLVSEFGITPVARLRLGLLSVQGATLAEMFSGGDEDNAPPTIDGDSF